MKVVTFAAGLSVGYLLGTRAGRDKYEQIVDAARQLRTHPTVVRAQEKVSSAVGTAEPASPASTVTAETNGTAGVAAATAGRGPASPRRGPATPLSTDPAALA